MNENAMRGTFGFVQLENDKFEGEQQTRGAFVVHVFTTGKLAGRLLIHYWGNKHFYAVIDRAALKPSRDAYFSEGSWVEPEWEGDSCRCTNFWAENYRLEGTEFVKFNPNCAANIITDEKALKIYGPFVGERLIASNVSVSAAVRAVTDIPVSGFFDVRVVDHNEQFAGFEIVPARQTGQI